VPVGLAFATVSYQQRGDGENAKNADRYPHVPTEHSLCGKLYPLVI